MLPNTTLAHTWLLHLQAAVKAAYLCFLGSTRSVLRNDALSELALGLALA